MRAVVRERPADATSLTVAVSRLVGGQRSSCRPSFAVAFEHRLPHRAQGEACVPLQPVQMPFEARDRRQVHRGPCVPVQSRREARQPASRPRRRFDRSGAADA